MPSTVIDVPSGHRVALAALDSSHDLIAVLDRAGTILLTNTAWQVGADRRGGHIATTGPGVNYLDVCERSDASSVADGVRTVLRGERQHFEVAYPCHTSVADAWYLLEATSLGEPGMGAVLTHADITALVDADRLRGHASLVDPVTMLATSPAGVIGLARTLADSQAHGNALAVVTITLRDLGEIESRHGRRFRDDLVVQTSARVLRVMSGEGALIRPSTNHLILIASVADAQGGHFLRDRIANALSTTYLVGATDLESRVEVDVVSSDRFSTLDSLLHESVGSPARMPIAPAAPLVSGSIGSIGDRAARDSTTRVPIMVYGLPHGHLQAANEAARSLFGLALGSGRLHARDIADPTDERHTAAALSALSSGAIDSYRARRTLVTTDGPVARVTSVRRMLVGSGAIAVVLTLPSDPDEDASTVDDRFAVALVAGTIDATGAITSLSSPNSPMEVELGAALGATLRQAAHPDDVAVVDRMLDSMLACGAAAGVLRVVHAEQGWVACQCQLFTIMRHGAHGSRSGSAPADHESYAFVVSTSISTKSMVDKLAKLESHLRHIGSEVQASDVEPSAGPTVDRGLAAALDALELTVRQRDIVERLARGERVPSIAAALYISRSTVRNHLAQVYRLVGVHSQQELLTALQAS